MTQQTRYALSEGTLTLPEAAQDTSVTILKLPQARATLVVTRAYDVKPGQEEAYLQQQLAKVKRDMKKFSARAVEDSSFGPLPARAVSVRFENQGIAIEQQLLAVRLESHLLVLTFSTSAGFAADAQATWEQIRQGFIPAGNAAEA
ncbi:Uncharacterized conserved protein [Serratia rubidaea]|uniref:DUF1795 domain-containing protein n=2 Tax=Serratia rubidaea TaxID=61652 RepID=A0A3S4X9U3_SERRU|nr:DcrB-related protein [Serratia rubidaea]MBD8452536.1 DUF1795 domain-containing protein [Serratia rubidaea]MBH1928740.1 DUF1795 domain-containing protein [Serratia rubidaea]MBS0975885.1 DUF1795 domain-containing protein [Serratia rubidaea]MBU3895159.1 DUF1795 domain-containing protein [Serratia rubidaea]MCR1000763.1 DUF1795 domain-containing protein [Serratia rubidaea]